MENNNIIDNNIITELDALITNLKDKSKIETMLKSCYIDNNGKFLSTKPESSLFPLRKEIDENDLRIWSFSWLPPLDTFIDKNEYKNHNESNLSSEIAYKDDKSVQNTLENHQNKSDSFTPLSYNKMLIQSKEFHNPFALHNMCLLYNISDYVSLYRNFEYPESESYRILRQKQEERWAVQRLEKGVQYAKKNDHTNAIRCYNEAINLVPTYSEAYTARGASYVKQRKIKEGILEFKKALSYNPNTENAAKYLNQAEMMLKRERITSIPSMTMLTNINHPIQTLSQPISLSNSLSSESHPNIMSDTMYNEYINKYLYPSSNISLQASNTHESTSITKSDSHSQHRSQSRHGHHHSRSRHSSIHSSTNHENNHNHRHHHHHYHHHQSHPDISSSNRNHDTHSTTYSKSNSRSRSTSYK